MSWYQRYQDCFHPPIPVLPLLRFLAKDCKQVVAEDPFGACTMVISFPYQTWDEGCLEGIQCPFEGTCHGVSFLNPIAHAIDIHRRMQSKVYRSTRKQGLAFSEGTLSEQQCLERNVSMCGKLWSYLRRCGRWNDLKGYSNCMYIIVFVTL